MVKDRHRHDKPDKDISELLMSTLQAHQTVSKTNNMKYINLVKV
jgi:hypothetical protein